MLTGDKRGHGVFVAATLALYDVIAERHAGPEA